MTDKENTFLANEQAFLKYRLAASVNEASATGFVLSIDHVPYGSPAMGHYTMVPDVRQARSLYNKDFK